MCTAVSINSDKHYFGRNLDYERTFGEAVTVTPRNFELNFRNCRSISSHYAIIGMAAVSQGYPLYFDAVNEKGLAIAGLNFPIFAKYNEFKKGADNIAPFELILWFMAQCANVREARKLAGNMNIHDLQFSTAMPNTPMHWIIADSERSIVLEPIETGLKIYDNPAGVLTNSPGFDMQLFNLNNYMNLSAEAAQNKFSEILKLQAYACGMGAMGLPGDFSSMSRFVKACFIKENMICDTDCGYNQVFRLLSSVSMPKGCVVSEGGALEYTTYSSCCDTKSGIYYLNTYGSPEIRSFHMHSEDISTDKLIILN